MKWPLISRRAYDILLRDKERLEAQNDKLMDNLTRQRRYEAGMAETPRPERKPAEPMPDELRQYIGGWPSKTRKLQMNSAYRRYRSGQGESWPDIMADMMREDEGLNLAVGEETSLAPDEETPLALDEDSPTTPVDTNEQ